MENLASFCKRWDISFNEIAKIQILKNKILNAVENNFRDLFVRDVINEYFNLCGQRYPDMLLSYNLGFCHTEVYYLLSNENDFIRFLFYIENLFYLSVDKLAQNKFYADLKEIICFSGLSIRITQSQDKVYILRKGVKILDVVVDNNLLHLEIYPKALKHFKIALTEVNNKEKWNSVLENLRQSLEQLLQSLFNNKKTLENNASVLNSKLKNLGVEGNIRNEISHLVNFFNNYFNSNSKHDLKEYLEEDVEFLMYEVTVAENYILKKLENKGNKL